MKILSLDCATKTGWAFVENGKVIESGVQDFTKKRGESNGILFLRFRCWLKGIVNALRPDVVVYERAHFRGGAATELCVGLQTRVQEVASEAQIEYSAYDATQIKKFATGSGKADKADIIIKVKPIIGRDPIDDNEADAVMIALFANNDLNNGNWNC